MIVRATAALLAAGLLLAGCSAARSQEFEADTFETSMGELEIIFIGHGTLMFSLAGRVIHIDPVGRYADYATLPDADLILITHEHGDHLDTDAIGQIATEGTRLICTAACGEPLEGSVIMGNGDTREEFGFGIEAVPAYNIVHMRSGDTPYHPRGSGNGYVLTFGDTRVYVAGDTENTPEMKALRDIDIAFLPMNLPYTMTPEMVADAARAFHPHILYPYHYGNTDPQELVELLADTDIEVRIRALR